MGTYSKAPRYIILNKRLQNTLFESTCSGLCAENSRNEQETEGTIASRDRGNAEERTNILDRSYTGIVFKLAVSCGEKGWRSASSNKFEESNFFVPYEHFKMESLNSL